MSHSSARKLVDTGLVRAWLWSALLWLLAFAVLGLLLAVKFYYPDFLGGLSWLTFGRLRPAHVNGMVFGVYSTAALGLLYYFVPMLCARPMVAADVGWRARLRLWLALAAVALQVAATVLRRREPQLYVSLYYVIMALVWMLLDLLIGGLVLPYFGVPGVTGAALQG